MNLNKVMMIGRLTRDPESRTFDSGGKVTFFGFAVNNRRKNSQTGEWEDDPMFIDVKIFNRGDWRKADQAEEWLRKGKLLYLEGRLVLERWESQNGVKRSKHVMVADDFKFLEPKQDGGSGYSTGYSDSSHSVDAPQSAPSGDNLQRQETPSAAAASGPPDEDIPF